MAQSRLSRTSPETRPLTSHQAVSLEFGYLHLGNLLAGGLLMRVG